MVKKTVWIVAAFTLAFWSCVTYLPPPPTLHIESPPAAVTAGMTLDERIVLEDAWRSLRQGNVAKAEKILAELGTDSPFYYAGLGYAYFIVKDLPAAEQAFSASLTREPDLVLGHIGLAQVYEEMGRDDLAFNSYREVLKKMPDHPWAKPRYESLKTRKTEESLEEGRLFLAAGDTEKSTAAYLKALHYSPLSNEAHLALAGIYRRENKLQNALVHLKAASTNAPEDRDILLEYADLLLQVEDYKKSLDVLEKLAAKVPSDQQVKDRLETVKNRLGIFELPSQYENIQASESVTKQDLAALLGVKFKDYLEEPSQEPQILVDISTSWASKFIIKTTSLGLLDVYPNHTFQPQKVVSRAEAAEILYRLTEYLKSRGHRFVELIPPEKIPIADVPPGNYYHRPIIQMIAYDIMGLYPDLTFRPDLPLSGPEAVRVMDIILALIE